MICIKFFVVKKQKVVKMVKIGENFAKFEKFLKKFIAFCKKYFLFL